MQGHVLNNRYEILTPIGQGGMAAVYRGRDLRLGRPVALKLLHNYYAADDEFLQRFAHEAMSAANLSSHPNIVDVYDVGQDGDVNYIVMELIEGDDLKNVIVANAPLPPEQALRIAIQVAEGLHYAHRRGLIHRDVKPQNVLLTPDGHVRIADFGIAKSHLSTAVTQAGMTFGTADYISPEQAQGLDATPQSDVYSLGVMLYEMLTGRLPFTGDTQMAVALQHIQRPPPALRQLNPSIPVALEQLVLRAMAKDPGHRPASAQDFAQQMRDYLAGRLQATVAAPVAPAPRPQPVPARSPERAQGRGDTRRAAPRPQYVAPPLAAAPERSSGGMGFGTLLLGLLLLVGVIVLVYVALNTDFGAVFPGPSGANASATAAPTGTAEPTPTSAPTGTPVPVVTVPNFVGQSEAAVVQEQLPQLNLGRRGSGGDPALEPRYSAEFPRGTVIAQDPAPNTEVPVGADVALVISLGPLPNVVGATADDAAAALQEGGLNVQQRTEPSRTVPAGRVVAQDPAAGSAPGRGSTATLTVSAGDVVAFPNVIANGTPLEQARQAVQDAGLNIVAEDPQGPDVLGAAFDQIPPNTVVSATANGQPVDPNGALVPRGANVVLAYRRP